MSSLYKYKDRVLVESTSTGTGDLTLGAAVSNLTRGVHRTFADAGYVNGDKVKYVIQHTTALEVETGRGTIGSSGQLKRDIGVNMSSNANALVSFSAGTKHVYVTLDEKFAGEEVVHHEEVTATGSIGYNAFSYGAGEDYLLVGSNLKYDGAGAITRYSTSEQAAGFEVGQYSFSLIALTAAGVQSSPWAWNAVTNVIEVSSWLGIKKNAAPADGDIDVSEGVLYWDPVRRGPEWRGKNGAGSAATFTPASTTEVTAAQAAAQAYADSLVVGLLDDRGNYDASVNTFPVSGGSGTAGAVLKGDIWRISVAGTLGAAVAVGDWLRALVDTPGQTASNWAIAESNLSLPVAVADGGTGATTAANARTNLSVPGLTTVNEFTARQEIPASFGDITTDADAATITIDWSAASRRKITLTANRTIAFSNEVDGQSVVIIFVSGGTGAFVPVWPAGIRWQGGAAPTLTNTSGRRDLVGIYRESSGNYIGTFASDFY